MPRRRLALPLLLLAAACGGPANEGLPPTPGDAVQRLELEPLGEVTPAPSARRELARWEDLAAEGGAAGWAFRNTTARPVPFGDMRLLVLDRSRPLEAAVAAPLSFRSTPRVRLSAVVRGEGFMMTARLERDGEVVARVQAPLVRSRGVQEFVIDFPSAAGTGAALVADTLVLGLPPGPLPVGLSALTVEDLPVGGKLPAEAFGGVALLEIGADGRQGSVLTGEAGARARFTLAGSGLELRFADAVPAGAAEALGAAELEVVLRDAAGTELRRRFTPTAAWSDRVVPLDELAPGEVTAEFHARPASGGEALLALARPWVARPLEAPPTVLLVTSDTHRADHLGFLAGEDGPRTELIDRLAARGVSFLDAVSSINNTTPSHVALMTGTTPRDTGILSNAKRLAREAPTLADRFAERGFVTLAAVSAAPVCSEFSALDQGFDRYSNPDFRSARDGAETLAQLLEWLPAVEDQPLFVWLHLYDAHSPYDPPEALTRLYYPEDLEPFEPASPMAQPELAPHWAPDIMDPVYTESLYKGEVSYVDERLAELFRHERFWEGLVALTADHGETLRSGGVHRYGHHTLSHANLAVPLVLVGPGLEPGARLEAPVEQIDVGRTLLDLAGFPDADFPGRNLLAAAETTPPDGLRFALEANGYSAAVLRGRWMLKLGLREDRSVLEKTGDWYHRAELYDVTVDEACEHDLSAEQPELARELREALVGWLRSRSARGWSREAAGDADAVARQLAELGYTGSDPADAGREWVPAGCACENCRAAR
jgi:arylsulfatase A-like enzyme